MKPGVPIFCVNKELLNKGVFLILFFKVSMGFTNCKRIGAIFFVMA